MRLISIAGRTLVRFVSASAVRIALTATLTTPQPAVARPAVIDTLAEQLAPAYLAAERADGNGSAATAYDKQAPMSGFVGPGPGWG